MNDFINNKAKEQLDFDYILGKIEVLTPYGLDKKNNLKPYLCGSEDKLKEELDILEIVVNQIRKNQKAFIRIKSSLVHTKDIRGSLERAKNKNILTIVELFEIKFYIFILKELECRLKNLECKLPESISLKQIHELESLLDPKKNGIKTFFIYDEYSKELEDIRKQKRELASAIKKENNKIKAVIKQSLELNVRTNGEITVPKDDLELLEKVKKSGLLEYSSETYISFKYKIKMSEEVEDCLKEMDTLKAKEEEEELKVRKQLSNRIAELGDKLNDSFEKIANLDFIIAKAFMAIKTDSIKPIIENTHMIEIQQGRHLKVSEELSSKGHEYMPISVDIDKGVTCITGANMGGKTISIKLIGMLCLMAQYGLFVPCKYMKTSLHDFIFISIGDMQSIGMGLSTFGGEIHGINEAIKKSDKRGLILIDELASGTNPSEGYALSKALVKYLLNKKSISIITTHFDNVANISKVKHLQVIGLENIDYEKLKTVIAVGSEGIESVRMLMDYRLKEVTNTEQVPRDAINIARLMGMEESIVSDAEEIMREKY